MDRFTAYKRLLFLPLTVFGLFAFSIGTQIGEDLSAHLDLMRDVELRIDAIGRPVRLSIPAIDLEIPVIEVGQTANGNMDIPSHPFEAGWYKAGARPGDPGNAVLAAHLDTVSGKPAAFWQLHTLKTGDEIQVTDERGRMTIFRVTGSEIYDADNAPLREIFGFHNRSRLNLITCNGAWDGAKQSYDKRLVVFTEKVE